MRDITETTERPRHPILILYLPANTQTLLEQRLRRRVVPLVIRHVAQVVQRFGDTCLVSSFPAYAQTFLVQRPRRRVIALPISQRAHAIQRLRPRRRSRLCGLLTKCPRQMLAAFAY